jgi:hypothetical protein
LQGFSDGYHSAANRLLVYPSNCETNAMMLKTTVFSALRLFRAFAVINGYLPTGLRVEISGQSIPDP